MEKFIEVNGNWLFSDEHFLLTERGWLKTKELYKFTEDDVRNVIEIAEEMGWNKCRKDLRLKECYNQSSNDSEQILIQLSQPKEPIAVEIETTTIHSPTDPANYYDVEVIKTQTIDGKEYCIINKIYYK